MNDHCATTTTTTTITYTCVADGGRGELFGVWPKHFVVPRAVQDDLLQGRISKVQQRLSSTAIARQIGHDLQLKGQLRRHEVLK